MKRNRQSARSQRMLRTALLELLTEKPIYKIGVSEITNRADLSRSTFYKHFNTKEDLLESILDEILDQFFEHIFARDISNPDPKEDVEINVKLFNIWLENVETIQTLGAMDIDCLLVNKFKKYFQEYQARKVKSVFPDRRPALGEYTNNFLAYSFVGILRCWIESGMKHPPKVVGHLLYQLTGPPVLETIYENFNDLIT